ncbi:MAG: LacI family DNA-binding transcriptional regulator [Terrimicrobiaceae bacterium]
MAVPKKNNKKRNSIYTLAEDLNLNPGTVSRALRNRPEVSEETRMQVQKRADELGFRLQRFRPRTVNVCVLVQTVSTQESIFSSYVNAVMDGLWRYCMQNDLELSLYSATIEKLNAGFLVRQLANRGVNGVVVVNASDDSRYFRLFNKEVFPYCAVMDGPEEARPWTLHVDSLRFGRRAADYLIGLGHRRIAILLGNLRYENFRLRLEAYRAALREHHLAEDDNLVLLPEKIMPPCSDDFSFGASGAAELLRLSDPPTAILTMSDESAMGALHTLHRQGFSVPGDMSLICFDDTRMAQFTNPSLTVVNIPNTDLGFEAGMIVHQRILKKEFTISENVSSRLGGDLLIRDSCGPAKSARPSA